VNYFKRAFCRLPAFPFLENAKRHLLPPNKITPHPTCNTTSTYCSSFCNSLSSVGISKFMFITVGKKSYRFNKYYLVSLLFLCSELLCLDTIGNWAPVCFTLALARASDAFRDFVYPYLANRIMFLLPQVHRPRRAARNQLHILRCSDRSAATRFFCCHFLYRDHNSFLQLLKSFQSLCLLCSPLAANILTSTATPISLPISALAGVTRLSTFATSYLSTLLICTISLLSSCLHMQRAP
jgi:hypothetical protein